MAINSKPAAETETLPVLRISGSEHAQRNEPVVRESPLTILLNDRELVTLLCTPADLKYLAVGFLAAEGLIKNKTDIKRVVVDDQRGVARVETETDEAGEELFKRLITSGCGRGAAFYSAVDVSQLKVESLTGVAASQVFALARDFQRRSETYRATGGVHSAALCDNEHILVCHEDIGRHNAIDKVFGECLLNEIPTADRFILTSGRIASEILLKIARRNVPILISKSAPTTLAVRLAADLGVTLIGFVRGQRLNVYTNAWRVTTGG